MNPRGALSELDGTWVPIAADVSGQALVVRELRVVRLVLDRGRYEIIDCSDAIVDRGEIRIDRSATPPSMDIVGSAGPNAGRTMLAIFELESMHSRNRRAGILIGQGMKTDEAIKEIGMVVEGIKTTKSAFKLAEQYDIVMPITTEIYSVLYHDNDVKESISNLMVRDRKHEMENIVLEKNISW